MKTINIEIVVFSLSNLLLEIQVNKVGLPVDAPAVILVKKKKVAPMGDVRLCVNKMSDENIAWK